MPANNKDETPEAKPLNPPAGTSKKQHTSIKMTRDWVARDKFEKRTICMTLLIVGGFVFCVYLVVFGLSCIYFRFWEEQ